MTGVSPRRRPPPPPLLLRFGRHEFEQAVEVARGAFGIVYQAFQPVFDRTVAIKVLTGANDRMRERFSIPVLVVLLQLPRRFWRALGAGIGLLAIIAYMFAPNWRVPTRYYYINGIDPATVPYFLVIVGGLCFAALAPSLSPKVRRIVLVGTIVVVAVNAVVAIPAMYAAGYVNDTGVGKLGRL